jgi:hypothetical protein
MHGCFLTGNSIDRAILGYPSGARVISLLTISFLAAGSVLWMMTLKSLKRMPKMFEASLAELLRDRHHLGG